MTHVIHYCLNVRGTQIPYPFYIWFKGEAWVEWRIWVQMTKSKHSTHIEHVSACGSIKTGSRVLLTQPQCRTCHLQYRKTANMSVDVFLFDRGYVKISTGQNINVLERRVSHCWTKTTNDVTLDAYMFNYKRAITFYTWNKNSANFFGGKSLPVISSTHSHVKTMLYPSESSICNENKAI